MSVRRSKRKGARRLQRVRMPIGGAPGVIVSPLDSVDTKVAFMLFSEQRFKERSNIDLASLRQTRREQGSEALWVDVCGLGNVEVLQSIRELFAFHPLSMEDVVHIHQRPKLDRHSEHLFVVLRMPQFEDGVLELEQLSLFLGPGFLVSFQERPGDVFEPLRERLRQGHEHCRQLGAAFVLYSLIDAVVDNVFPVLENFEQRLEQLEEEILGQPHRNPMAELLTIRKDFQRLRWALLPLRDVVRGLMGLGRHVGPELSPFLADCHDHINHAVELLENSKETVASLVELYLSLVNQRMNEVMKVLTVIATVFIPLSFIASVYGMNFDTQTSPLNMPELGWYFGYPFALFLMAMVAFSFLYVFWRRGWLKRSSSS